MAEITSYLGLEKPVGGEKHSRAMVNRNYDRIEAEALKQSTKTHRQARYRMIANKTAGVGIGTTFGPVEIDPSKAAWTTNNNFSQADNTPDNAVGSTGRIKILTSGFYDIQAMLIPTGNPLKLSFKVTVSGEMIITDSRDSTYGDWEMHGSATGIYIAANQHIEGTQANDGGASFGLWIVVKQVHA